MFDPHVLDMAETAFLAGDLDRAESIVRGLLEGEASRPAASHLLGAIALRRQRVEEAIRWFDAAIEGGYKTPISLNNCGEAYRLAGQLDKAFAFFQQSLMQDNENPYPHFNLGLLMRTWGQAPESEHFFRTALAINPGMARAHLELAELYRAEGHVPEAEAEYREAIRLLQGARADTGVGRLEQCRIRFASFLREHGRPREAVHLLSPLPGNVPRSAECLLELAVCEFELAWEPAAERHYREAIRSSPSMAMNEIPRIAMLRTGSVRDWCESGRGRYRPLAPSRSISISPLKTVPAGRESAFLDGQALAPELFCAELPGGEVIPGDFAVIVDELFFSHGVINWAYHYARRGQQVRHESDDGRLMLDLPASKRQVSGTCALLGPGNNQYQWLCETLPRLWVLAQFPEYAGVPVIVSAEATVEQLELLARCGVSASRLVKMGSNETLVVERLVVPSLMSTGHWVSPVALQFLRRALGNASVKGDRRIYLSRAGCSNRRVVNEDELLPVLQRHGFEVLDASRLDSRSALRVFGESEIVIGTDDDLLANMVAAPSGTHLGVIAMGGEHRPILHYLCGPLAISTSYLMGSIEYRSSPSLASCDVRLPAELLEQYLTKVFFSGSGPVRQAGV